MLGPLLGSRGRDPTRVWRCCAVRRIAGCPCSTGCWTSHRCLLAASMVRAWLRCCAGAGCPVPILTAPIRTCLRPHGRTAVLLRVRCTAGDLAAPIVASAGEDVSYWFDSLSRDVRARESTAPRASRARFALSCVACCTLTAVCCHRIRAARVPAVEDVHRPCQQLGDAVCSAWPVHPCAPVGPSVHLAHRLRTAVVEGASTRGLRSSLAVCGADSRYSEHEVLVCVGLCTHVGCCGHVPTRRTRTL